jgi:transposase
LEKKRTSKKNPRVKANTSGKKKKRGRKPGFEGTSRKKPDHVNEVVDVTLPFCPGCGALLEESYEKRERYVEDIVIVRPRVTKYIIHRYRCPHCKTDSSAAPDGVIPHCTLGINVMLLAAYQKFELHLSYDKIRRNF